MQRRDGSIGGHIDVHLVVFDVLSKTGGFGKVFCLPDGCEHCVNGLYIFGQVPVFPVVRFAFVP